MFLGSYWFGGLGVKALNWKGQVIVCYGTNSEENDNEFIHDQSKKYVFLRDYWISKIKNITKNCCILMVSGESIPKNHRKKIFCYVRNLNPIFKKMSPKLIFYTPINIPIQIINNKS